MMEEIDRRIIKQIAQQAGGRPAETLWLTAGAILLVGALVSAWLFRRSVRFGTRIAKHAENADKK
jgi:hypothetical protein